MSLGGIIENQEKLLHHVVCDATRGLKPLYNSFSSNYVLDTNNLFKPEKDYRITRNCT